MQCNTGLKWVKRGYADFGDIEFWQPNSISYLKKKKQFTTIHVLLYLTLPVQISDEEKKLT